MDLKDQKSVLRKEFSNLRKKLGFEYIKKESNSIVDQILMSDEYKNANTIFCYISYNNEPDTFRLLEAVLHSTKKLCLPVINDQQMFAAETFNLKDLVKNKYGRAR